MQKSMNTAAEDLIRANQNCPELETTCLVNVDFPSSNDHAQ